MTIQTFTPEAIDRIRRDHVELRGELRTWLHRLQRKIDGVGGEAGTQNAIVAMTYVDEGTPGLSNRFDSLGDAEFTSTYFDYSTTQIPSSLSVLKAGVYWVTAYCRLEIALFADGNDWGELEIDGDNFDDELYQSWAQPVDVRGLAGSDVNGNFFTWQLPLSIHTMFVKTSEATASDIYLKGRSLSVNATVSWLDVHLRVWRVGDVSGTFEQP